MIKTIVFDIGNVLAAFDWQGLYKKQGYDDAMVERLGKATVLSGFWTEYDRGCLRNEEVLELFIGKDKEIEADIRKALSDFSGIVTRYEYAIPWIQELKKKGYQVLYLSNFSEIALQKCWNALDFLPYTDGGILSFQDKLIKPDPAIYHLLMYRYHLKAEECVFLDDTLRNVEAARAVGMYGIHFISQAQAVSELAALGVG